MDTVEVIINVFDVDDSGVVFQINSPKPFRGGNLGGSYDIVCSEYAEPMYEPDAPYLTLWLNPDEPLNLCLTEKEFEVLLDRFKKYDTLKLVVNGWKRERYTL